MDTRVVPPMDAAAIAMIYNQGVDDRVPTCETEPRTAAVVHTWFDGRHPIFVVEQGQEVIVERLLLANLTTSGVVRQRTPDQERSHHE